MEKNKRNITKLVPIAQQGKEAVIRTLEASLLRARSGDLSSVIVIEEDCGDGEMHIREAGSMSNMEKVGLLSLAMQHISGRILGK